MNHRYSIIFSYLCAIMVGFTVDQLTNALIFTGWQSLFILQHGLLLFSFTHQISGVLLNTGSDRIGQDRTGSDRIGPDRTFYDIKL